MVDRVGAGINQVAARVLENRQEPFVRDRGIDHAKRISHRTVQPRISLVEEAPRRRRRLSNEQKPNDGRTVPVPKTFPLRFHLGFFASQPHVQCGTTAIDDPILSATLLKANPTELTGRHQHQLQCRFRAAG
jgi:hypothetical protein